MGLEGHEMNEDAVRAFWSRLEADPALQARMDDVLEAAGPSGTLQAEVIVGFAAKNGFEFTVDDLQAQLVSDGELEELTDSQLDSVVGGATVLNDWIQSARCGKAVYSNRLQSIILF
jgi:predicted ribosomally synthesized peptide with nif11-like leader